MVAACGFTVDDAGWVLFRVQDVAVLATWLGGGGKRKSQIAGIGGVGSERGMVKRGVSQREKGEGGS